MKLPTYDVAVIGTGFTGSALAVQLVEAMPAKSKILLLGTPKATAKGVAYGTAEPRHLLNVRAGRMSMRHDDPSHFVRWLWQNGEGDAATQAEIAEAYVPRMLYGRYLLESLQQAVRDAAGRLQVDIVDGTATEVAEQDGMYTVRAATGARYAARSVALCLGHGRPEFPIPAEFVDPEARERMIADPWSDVRIERIGRDDRVLLVGTGLTMVDQVLSLGAGGHRGPVTALSRRGHLPTGHCDRRTEPIAIDIPKGALTLRRLARLVIAAARAEDAAGRDWRAIIDGLEAGDAGPLAPARPCRSPPVLPASRMRLVGCAAPHGAVDRGRDQCGAEQRPARRPRRPHRRGEANAARRHRWAPGARGTHGRARGLRLDDQLLGDRARRGQCRRAAAPTARVGGIRAAGPARAGRGRDAGRRGGGTER